MPIDMKTVKAITHNNKSVSSITDSNNNIIWGSYDAFPYRVLEYIHFNGAEYIQTDFTGGDTIVNHQCEFTVEDTPDSSSARTLIGIYDNSLTDSRRRFYPIWYGTNGLRCSIGNMWSSYATNFSLNQKLKVSLTLSYNNSNKLQGYWYLIKAATGANIGSAAPLTNSSTGSLNTSTMLKLGCQVVQNGDEYNYWLGKVYYYRRRQTNSTGTLLSNYIPCQRKSDGVCGMYDTVAQVFNPMVGTTITDAAAGPVVKEYYNGHQELQSISISNPTTTLTRGDTFSFGGTVTATLYDPALETTSTVNVTNNCTFSGYNMSVSGTYTVTVTYSYNGQAKTATYTLTVNPKWETVWTGSQVVSGSYTYNGGTTYATPTTVLYTDASFTRSRLQKVRTTFTGPTYSGGQYGTSTKTSAGTSPYEFSNSVTTGTRTIWYAKQYIKDNYYSATGSTTTNASVYLTAANESGVGIKFYVKGSVTKNPIVASDNSTSATITKLEIYY